GRSRSSPSEHSPVVVLRTTRRLRRRRRFAPHWLGSDPRRERAFGASGGVLAAGSTVAPRTTRRYASSALRAARVRARPAPGTRLRRFRRGSEASGVSFARPAAFGVVGASRRTGSAQTRAGNAPSALPAGF